MAHSYEADNIRQKEEISRGRSDTTQTTWQATSGPSIACARWTRKCRVMARRSRNWAPTTPCSAETDARAILNGERIAYWVGQGAKPTEKVQILINKYGQEGSHLEQQQAALERLSTVVNQQPHLPEPVPVYEEETPAAADADAPARR